MFSTDILVVQAGLRYIMSKMCILLFYVYFILFFSYSGEKDAGDKKEKDKKKGT